MDVEVLREAAADLVEGVRFYEEQAPGLGEYFLECLQSDIASLRLFGGIHAKEYGFHRLLAKRFPFAIYYAVDPTTVYVRAVLDCRRDPSWTRKRLTD